MSYGYKRMAESLDSMVLGAIESYGVDKPATSGDLFGMIAIQHKCSTFGIWDAKAVLGRSIQRLKKSGKIVYISKPAGWVVCN